MHSTGSAIYTVIERVRAYLDDANVDSQYNDDYLTRHIMMPAMVDVLTRINMSNDLPIVSRLDVDMVVDQEYYQLPPCIQEVWALQRYSSDGHLLEDWRPRGPWHPEGPGWRIQGNLLQVFPVPKNTKTWTILHTHNGDCLVHYATDGQMDEDLETLTLGTPQVGALDRRPNSYAGSILRLLPSSGVIEERVIASHDASAGTVTVRRPFTYASEARSSSSSAEELAYEIVPAISSTAIWEAIAARCALKLAAYRKLAQTHYSLLLQEYKSATKTVIDTASNSQLRTGKFFNKLTIDREDRAW